MMLIVEDDEDEVFFLRRGLDKSGERIPVQVVVDGREALAYLFGEKQYEDRRIYPLPNVMLLDLKIPYVPGIEVLRRLREVPELKKVIVIIHSTSASPSDIDAAYAAGANSYLVKASHLAERERVVAMLKNYWFDLNHGPTLNPALIKGAIPEPLARPGEQAEWLRK